MTRKEALWRKTVHSYYCGGCIYFSGITKPMVAVGFCHHKESLFKNMLLHRDFGCKLHKFPKEKKKGKVKK